MTYDIRVLIAILFGVVLCNAFDKTTMILDSFMHGHICQFICQ